MSADNQQERLDIFFYLESSETKRQTSKFDEDIVRTS